jgi:hypothetical protein
VAPWIDPAPAGRRFPVSSAYVEACWLGVIGPTAAWTLRRLSAVVQGRPNGVWVDLPELAQGLGVGRSTRRNSVLSRTIDRLVSFGLASWDGEVLRIPEAVPPLTTRQVSRLTPSLARVHERMLQAGRDGAGVV